MGNRHRSPVREVVRRGKRILVLDFSYRDSEGRVRRYRRDATCQSSKIAARAEADRLLALAATTGDVIPKGDAISVRQFYDDTFVPTYLPTFSPNTADRYRSIAKDLIALLGSRRLSDVSSSAVQRAANEIAKRGTAERPFLNFVRTVLSKAVLAGALERVPAGLPVPQQAKRIPECPGREDIASLIGALEGWARPCCLARTAPLGDPGSASGRRKPRRVFFRSPANVLGQEVGGSERSKATTNFLRRVGPRLLAAVRRGKVADSVVGLQGGLIAIHRPNQTLWM